MKKLFSLIAAVLFAGSMFAAEYVKVTAAPENWAGEYLIVYEKSETEAFVFNGQDAANGYAAATIADGKITSSDLAAYEATIAAMEGGYSVKVGEKYLSGTKNDNKLNFTDDAALNTLEYSTDNVLIISNTSVLRFNSASNQLRFRYFKAASYANQKAIQLYKKGEGGVTPPQPAIASPYCQTEVGHFLATNADPNSFVLLSIGSKGGKTIVRIDQDAAKNTQMFDYLQVTGLASEGADVAEGGATAMAVEFATPAAVDDSITLEILWSNPGWPGRWMVQNVKVPATAECEYAVLVPAPVVKKTCAEVYTLAKNDAVALNDVVVTYVNGKNVWVKDATASMLVFLPAANDAIKAGDVLSEVAGVVDIYNGVYEVKPSAEQVTAIVATPGEAPAAEVVTEVALTDVNKYIVMQNVEFAEEAAFAEGTQSNITINGVTVRNQFKNGYSFTAGKKYNVYGVVTIYSSTPQVYFITAEEASSTAIDNTVVSEKAIKMFENGQLIIIKNGVKYNALGSVIE